MRLIDAYELTSQIEQMKDVNRDDVIALIARQRPVDGVPREQYQRMVDTVASLTEYIGNKYIGNIVRCKDCNKRVLCRTSNIWATPPADDWFCADGERRGGE